MLSLFLLLAIIPIAHALTVSIPLQAPQGAPTVSPSLVSISIEQDRWPDWAGSHSTNTFVFNAFNNLKQLSGEAPWIRIGADSEDHTDFSPHVKVSQTVFPAETDTVPYPEASNITVGDGFYQLASRLPSNTHVIWGLNLGQNNLSAAFLEAKSVLKAFNSPAFKEAGITLDFLEIGNEADLYFDNGDRNSSWNVQEYIAEWIAFATNISTLLPSDGPKFFAAAFADSSHSINGFSPQALFNGGILDSDPGSRIEAISQHHYSGSFCAGNGGLLQDLMTKSTIRSNLSSFSPDIAATLAQELTYVLGETNSYACHGAPGVSNTAGAAIWALDYSLYASQIGITRLHFHEGVGYKYNLIQPSTLTRSTLDGSPLSTPLPPHIQPQYYAAIIAAEAIGPSGQTQVSELNINDPQISGYAFFEGGILQRAVLINSEAFLNGSSTARNTTHVNLGLTGDCPPTEATVKRLRIGHADDTAGLTWGGQTYETDDALVHGSQTVQHISIAAGLNISETEVLMLSFV